MTGILSRKVAVLLALLMLLFAGLAASCDTGGGMYQGGRDSAPHYR